MIFEAIIILALGVHPSGIPWENDPPQQGRASPTTSVDDFSINGYTVIDGKNYFWMWYKDGRINISVESRRDADAVFYQTVSKADGLKLLRHIPFPKEPWPMNALMVPVTRTDGWGVALTPIK
jgi:hypothetical protein